MYGVPGVPKMTPTCCFLLVLEVILWLSDIHQSSEKYLFSDMVVCAFSEGGFGEILALMRCPMQDPPNLQCIFVAVAALNTQGRS